MNNNTLLSKKEEITKNGESLVAKINELTTQAQKLITEAETLKRNLDATNGALQLLDMLIKENEPAETPKFEVVD